MKLFSHIIKVMAVILVLYIISQIVGLIYWFSMPTRTTKDFAYIEIEEGYIFDYNDMLDPPEEYDMLLNIEQSLRDKVAEYMRENNYRLKCGKQKFIINRPTYKELLDCFEFDVIK